MFKWCQLTVGVETQRPLNRRSLTWVFLRNRDHNLHTLGSHQHLIETQEGVLESSTEVFARLVLCLLPQLVGEELFTKFCTFDTTVTIKHCKQTNLIVECWVSNMGVFLYQ